jgi:hypothetical protein
LSQIAQKFNLGLKIEKAKDGPCEDGRNVITEWKFLPPDVTIENAAKLFEDFGIISSTQESEEGLFITFSTIFDTLPLCSLMNPHDNHGSKWFYVFGNRPTLCRFVSSLSCSNCQLQGHHHSRCPAGLPEVAKQYRKLILGNKASAASSNISQNQQGTTWSSSAKKSAKHRSSSGGTKDKDSNPPDDISSDGMKKQKTKKKKTQSSTVARGGARTNGAEAKPLDQLSEFSLPSSSGNGTGSGIASCSMDTSLDSQHDLDSIKRHEGSTDAGVSGASLTKGFPNVRIDVNNSFANNDSQKRSKK